MPVSTGACLTILGVAFSPNENPAILVPTDDDKQPIGQFIQRDYTDIKYIFDVIKRLIVRAHRIES